jgi:hypothetical protein
MTLKQLSKIRLNDWLSFFLTPLQYSMALSKGTLLFDQLSYSSAGIVPYHKDDTSQARRPLPFI